MFGYIYKKDVAIIAVVLCLCLGVGSFFDYQISSALFNIGSMYGRFVEAAGELPFELTASIAGVMLVRSARPDSKASKWLAALGVLNFLKWCCKIMRKNIEINQINPCIIFL